MDGANRWIIAAVVALVCATGIFVLYSYVVSTHMERTATISGTTSKRPPPGESMSDPEPGNRAQPDERSNIPPAGPSSR
jgi:hypothetical protein